MMGTAHPFQYQYQEIQATDQIVVGLIQKMGEPDEEAISRYRHMTDMDIYRFEEFHRYVSVRIVPCF